MSSTPFAFYGFLNFHGWADFPLWPNGENNNFSCPDTENIDRKSFAIPFSFLLKKKTKLPSIDWKTAGEEEEKKKTNDWPLILSLNASFYSFSTLKRTIEKRNFCRMWFASDWVWHALPLLLGSRLEWTIAYKDALFAYAVLGRGLLADVRTAGATMHEGQIQVKIIPRIFLFLRNMIVCCFLLAACLLNCLSHVACRNLIPDCLPVHCTHVS